MISALKTPENKDSEELGSLVGGKIWQPGTPAAGGNRRHFSPVDERHANTQLGPNAWSGLCLCFHAQFQKKWGDGAALQC